MSRIFEIGENIFNGYVGYGYTNRNLYIFEAYQHGNVTYVFKGGRNTVQLTKHDIIQDNLCPKRVVHAQT